MTVGIALNVIAIAALLAIVLWWGRRPTEAVRLRNALRLQPSRDEDFTWTPPNFPPGFAVERREPSPEFRAIISSLGIDAIPGDWNKALALAGHLTERAEDKGPVRADPLTTYRAIRNGYGYCADFVKVFLVLAHAAGLIVRQWAFSFDGFGGHGHIVVEVYVRDDQRWVMLDVFNNVMPLRARDGATMSAREFVEAFRQDESLVNFVPIGPGRPGYRYDDKLRAYYRWGIDEWYLWNGNNVVSRAANHPLVGVLADIAEPLGELASIAFGDFPKIVPLKSSTNAAQVEHMLSLRTQLLIIAALCIALTLALVVEGVMLFRTRRNVAAVAGARKQAFVRRP